MVFTRTQIKIMKLVCGKITAEHSIRQLAQQLRVGYAIAHTAVQSLLKQELLKKDNHKLIRLNSSANLQDLAYIESLRSEEFKDKYPDIALFSEKLILQNQGFFILLVFGSYAKGNPKRDSDVDILMIVEKVEDSESKERFLNNLTENYLKKAECRVIGVESAKEMLSKRNKLNVMNETLNSHILLFGAEAYYKLLQEE